MAQDAHFWKGFTRIFYAWCREQKKYAFSKVPQRKPVQREDTILIFSQLPKL
jgi:hypothetical protein